MIVTPFTHEPTHKTVWDVRPNGNVFPGSTVWDVHKNGNVFLGFTVWDVHTYGNDFWDSPCGMYIPMEMIGFRCLARSHMAPAMSQEGLSPMISGSCGKDTLSHTLTWQWFQVLSRKGVKNRLFRTDAHQW